MSFSLPTFNLECNIYTGDNVWLPPRLTSDCNLAYGRRTAVFIFGAGGSSFSGQGMTLLLPPLTDIRDDLCASGADGVEVPAGSGRFYVVESVDDAGKGFPNEHRVALLTKTPGPAAAPWPTPIP
jgi:hypothetical protein